MLTRGGARDVEQSRTVGCEPLHVKVGSNDDRAVLGPCPRGPAQQLGMTLTSTLVMSQSLTALLWTPLVTIWKPLAVAVWRSTGDEGREGQPGLASSSPQHPRP